MLGLPLVRHSRTSSTTVALQGGDGTEVWMRFRLG